MKREIKFRGKSLDGIWEYGDLHLRCKHPHIHNLIGAKIYIDQNTIGQFTGLRDKNGKEIYEGDILRGDEYPYNDDGVHNYLGIVFFADDDHAWEVMKFVTTQSKCSGISNFTHDEFYEIDFSKMEVIGNLWDSKGLFRDSDEDIMKWFLDEL